VHLENINAPYVVHQNRTHIVKNDYLKNIPYIQGGYDFIIIIGAPLV
jgi:hypothetical protein